MNHGFVNEEQIALIESNFYYVDSLKTIKDGLNLLNDGMEFNPKEFIYYIQKSTNK